MRTSGHGNHGGFGSQLASRCGPMLGVGSESWFLFHVFSWRVMTSFVLRHIYILQGKRPKKHPDTGSFDTGLWLWTSLCWGTLFGRFGFFPVETKKTHRSRVIVVAKKGFQYVFSSLFIYLLFCWFDFFSLFHRVSCCFTLFDVASLQQFSFFLQSNTTSSFVLSKVKCSASAVHQIFDGCGQLRTGNFGQMCRKCIGF